MMRASNLDQRRVVRWGIAAAMLLQPLFQVPWIPGPRASAEELHVSPQGSDLEGDGSPGRPLRTIAEAWRRLEIAPSAAIVLAPGNYSAATTRERFPLHFEPQGSLEIRGPGEGGATISGGGEDCLLEFVPGPQGASVRLQSLQVHGGLSGVSIVGSPAGEFGFELLACRFTGQRYQSVEVVAGEGGRARALIAGNSFDGGAIFGIDLATRTGSQLDFSVEDNSADGSAIPPQAGSAPLRYAASIYLDMDAAVRGTMTRNSFIDVPAGILVLEEPFEGPPGRLDLEISSCRIAGSPVPGKSLLRHGIYLSIRPVHISDIRIRHCTLACSSGFGIYEEGFTGWDGLEENCRLMISGCIFWNTALGEFSAELGGKTLPAYYREVRGNILPTSSRKAADGNTPLDPLLGPDCQPLEGSPAIDAGPETWTPPDDRDARGACRLADGDGDGIYRIDLGALESPGTCWKDNRPFIRGDCDGNGSIEITDAVGTFLYLFLGGNPPSCPDSCDTNDDGDLNISDGIYTLGFLFTGGEVPPAPWPGGAFDPTPDDLGACRTAGERPSKRSPTAR